MFYWLSYLLMQFLLGHTANPISFRSVSFCLVFFKDIMLFISCVFLFFYLFLLQIISLLITSNFSNLHLFFFITRFTFLYALFFTFFMLPLSTNHSIWHSFWYHCNKYFFHRHGCPFLFT